MFLRDHSSTGSEASYLEAAHIVHNQSWMAISKFLSDFVVNLLMPAEFVLFISMLIFTRSELDITSTLSKYGSLRCTTFNNTNTGIYVARVGEEKAGDR